MTSKRTNTALTVVLTVGATLGLAAAPPADAATGIPGVSCSVGAYGVGLSGAAKGEIIRRDYVIDRGKATITSHGYNPGRLGFVPKAMALTPGAGGSAVVEDTFLAIASGGPLYRAHAHGQSSYNAVTVSKVAVNNTWGGIRTLDFSPSGGNGDYLYGLSDGGGFYRYVYTGTGAPQSRVTVGASGWKGVRTISFTRTTKVAGKPADVFLATTADGKLVEYTVPIATPSAWTRKDLRPATWGNFKALQSGDCYNASGAVAGRMLLGVTIAGDVYLYWDKNATDDTGGDIVGYGKVASGWTEKIYG